MVGCCARCSIDIGAVYALSFASCIALVSLTRQDPSGSVKAFALATRNPFGNCNLPIMEQLSREDLERYLQRQALV